jgi:hypothetical protein
MCAAFLFTMGSYVMLLDLHWPVDGTPAEAPKDKGYVTVNKDAQKDAKNSIKDDAKNDRPQLTKRKGKKPERPPPPPPHFNSSFGDKTKGDVVGVKRRPPIF